MTVENPYRAAGAFAGKAYIRRGADAELVEQIRDNQYYPYFAAPRQSGKSSLISRTMASLPAPEFRCALVDLSPFVVRSYDDFWRQFLHEVARSANFDPAAIGRGDPRDVFKAWLTAYPGRLVVFIDEIDVLLHVECREQIFSLIRQFFNQRANEPALRRLTFVLAGAAHSSRFISDPRWSPFNVAIEIPLEDLSMAQVSQLASYLATAGAFAGPDLVGRVFELTGGSVFLCQLVFEALWSRAARGQKKLEADDVDAVVTSIVAESPRNIHFYNIFRLVTQDARLAMLFRRMLDGEELNEVDRQELQLTGLCRGMNPFRNEVYARVFGAGGPLDLKVAGTKVALGRKLEAAITKRQQLEEEGKTTSQVEAEIAALKREFREGAQLREGDVLARGRYRLVGQIGQGGFATVWHARDESARREVALKVLHGQFAEDKTRRDRFFRGAWKMSELKHPAVVRVYEPYGEEGGRHFFVMEYMSGGTFHEAVLDKKLSADAVIAAIVAVGGALAHAHERGLVHRDVKPSNVLLGDGGAAKLTDFDLVREQDAHGSTRTGPMGSFIYAAPEVLNRPQDADHRADIYGLAMTAVFGLHGAELPLEVVRDADRFIDRLHCGGVMKDVLKKGVAWELERRFGSAAEFTQALATAWADKEVAAATGEKSKGPLPAWTAMFATLPLPESGPLANAAPPAGPGRALEAVPAAAPIAAASATAASTGGSTSALDFEDAQPTASGTAADVDAPTQVTRRATGREAAAVVVAAPTEKSRRGVFAALGLFATAALVLLALQIGGSSSQGRLGDGYEMGLHGSPASTRPAEPQVKSEQAPTKKDQVKGDTAAATTTTTATAAPATGHGGMAEGPPETDTTTGPAEETDADDVAGGTMAAAPTGAPLENRDGEVKRPAKPPVEARIDEGCLKVKAGNAEVGVKLLKDVREDRPHDVRLLTCLADGLLKVGDYSAADNFYRQLIAEFPRNKRGYLGAAQANENLARNDLAAKYYQQVLLLDPDNKSARAFLSSKAGSGSRLPPGGGLDLPR